jgi:hypothetical protein
MQIPFLHLATIVEYSILDALVTQVIEETKHKTECCFTKHVTFSKMGYFLSLINHFSQLCSFADIAPISWSCMNIEVFLEVYIEVYVDEVLQVTSTQSQPK